MCKWEKRCFLLLLLFCMSKGNGKRIKNVFDLIEFLIRPLFDDRRDTIRDIWRMKSICWVFCLPVETLKASIFVRIVRNDAYLHLNLQNVKRQLIFGWMATKTYLKQNYTFYFRKIVKISKRDIALHCVLAQTPKKYKVYISFAKVKK